MAAGFLFFRNNPSRSTAELCISVRNTLMFGLPIVQQVYGGMSVMYMGLSSVPFNLSLYSLSIWRLLRGGSVMASTLLSVITLPIVIMLLG